MLSRTADNLYWTARYVERADFLARILDSAARLTSLPATQDSDNTWHSVIASAGAAPLFYAKHKVATEQTVRDFLAFDPANPSSIRSCLDIARANGRAVRTALTTEMWEPINDAWHHLQTIKPAEMSNEDFVRFLEWVEHVTLVFDGSARRTMLRNDAYWFLRLGGAVERADNTARILDVKYHLLLPAREQVGGGLDFFQWTTILREVSALTAYHWVYRDRVKPWLVADLLILNAQMPRSLMSCYNVNRQPRGPISRGLWQAWPQPAAGPQHPVPPGRRRHGIDLPSRDCMSSSPASSPTIPPWARPSPSNTWSEGDQANRCASASPT